MLHLSCTIYISLCWYGPISQVCIWVGLQFDPVSQTCLWIGPCYQPRFIYKWVLHKSMPHLLLYIRQPLSWMCYEGLYAILVIVICVLSHLGNVGPSPADSAHRTVTHPLVMRAPDLGPQAYPLVRLRFPPRGWEAATPQYGTIETLSKDPKPQKGAENSYALFVVPVSIFGTISIIDQSPLSPHRGSIIFGIHFSTRVEYTILLCLYLGLRTQAILVSRNCQRP